MKLSEIHDEFVFFSGRTDLSDARMTMFINSGQRYLDRLDTIPKAIGKVYRTMNIGDWFLVFKECRAVKAVYMTSGEGRWLLTKKELGWLMLEYSDLIADIGTGAPKYYAPAILRMVPQDLTSITMSKFVGEVVQTHVKHFEYNGILWMPPIDETVVVEIHGLFYTEKLTTEDDESFWSVMHPDLLLMATFRALEVFYRNTEGRKDWESAIRDEVSTLGMDAVEEDIAGVDQIEG